MEDLALMGLGESERKLLAVFLLHGRDGRAITVESLAATVGVPDHSKELTTALRNLARADSLNKPAETLFLVRRLHFGSPGQFRCDRMPTRQKR